MHGPAVRHELPPLTSAEFALTMRRLTWPSRRQRSMRGWLTGSACGGCDITLIAC